MDHAEVCLSVTAIPTAALVSLHHQRRALARRPGPGGIQYLIEQLVVILFIMRPPVPSIDDHHARRFCATPAYLAVTGQRPRAASNAQQRSLKACCRCLRKVTGYPSSDGEPAHRRPEGSATNEHRHVSGDRLWRSRRTSRDRSRRIDSPARPSADDAKHLGYGGSVDFRRPVRWLRHRTHRCIGTWLDEVGIFTATTVGLFGLSGLASFVAALFAGLFIASLFVSYIADHFGRRAIFAYSLLWFGIANFIMGFQTTSDGVNFWRFISALGIGLELVTVDAYLSELVPRRVRGQSFAFLQAMSAIAFLIAYFLSWQLIPNAPFGYDGWRWVAWIGSVAAIVIWWIRLGLQKARAGLRSKGGSKRPSG